MKIVDKVALLYVKDRKVLSSRSFGKVKFYFPGGKREGSETDLETLCREIKEELDVDVIADSACFYGLFTAQADGKAEGVKVEMRCYTAEFKGELKPSGEIEELTWFTYKDKAQGSAVDELIFDDLYQKGLID